MITSVNTNVPSDVFVSDAPHHSQSQEWLIGTYDRGAILVCAELVPAFGDRSALDGALRQINATISPLDTAIAYAEERCRSRYRQAGGPRTRIMSDFLIGTVANADTFLTRDRRFYATYFPELQRQ